MEETQDNDQEPQVEGQKVSATPPPAAIPPPATLLFTDKPKPSVFPNIETVDPWFCIQLSKRSSEDKFICIRISDIVKASSKEKSPTFHKIKSSPHYVAYGTTESFFYYVRVIVSGSTDHKIYKCNHDQFMEKQLPLWESVSTSTLHNTLLCPFTLEVNKHIFLYGREAKRKELRWLGLNEAQVIESTSAVKETKSTRPDTFAYLYNLNNSGDPPRQVANPGHIAKNWFVVNFFTWRNLKGKEDQLMVVLKKYTDQEALDYDKDKLQIWFYTDRGDWALFMDLECSTSYHGKEQFVEVNGILFHIRGSIWSVYDLKEKKSKGYINGLNSLRETTGFNLKKDGSTDGLDGVACLTTSDSSITSLIFCATWISSTSRKNLHFAVISIFYGHEVISIENDETGEVSRSGWEVKALRSGSVTLDEEGYYIGQCFANLLTCKDEQKSGEGGYRGE